MTLVWCGIHGGWVPAVRPANPEARAVGWPHPPAQRVAHHRVKTVMGGWVPCPYGRVLITYMDRTRELPVAARPVSTGG